MGLPEHVRALRAKIGHDFLLLPGVCGLVFDDAGRILLNRRSDTGRWALIGGMPEPGEEPADAVVREVFEETGIRVEPLRITGVYATPRTTLPNGDQVQYIITAFRCRPISGEPRVNDDESLDVRYFATNELPDLRPDHRLRIKQAQGDQVCFTPPKASSHHNS